MLYTTMNISGRVAIITSASFLSISMVIAVPPRRRMGARIPILCIIPIKF